MQAAIVLQACTQLLKTIPKLDLIVYILFKNFAPQIKRPCHFLKKRKACKKTPK